MTSKLEKEFNEALKNSEKEIDKQMEIAREALNKAVEISEKYGVPFYASISPLGQDYRPASFDQKWSKLLEYDDDDYEDCDFYERFNIDLPEYEGWQHSSVC